MQSATPVGDVTPIDATASVPEKQKKTKTAERAFSLSLLFSGVRCIIQYVMLPFILPIIGIAGDFSVVISLIINTMALAGIIYSLRTFFKVNYRHKWRYVPVATVAIILLVSFTLLDIVEIYR
ncbi:MAG: hypothetical protein KC708_03875 [Anaerolineae bacterium]|nr:hypothetical protein [Anaerolineae bacterium]